VCPGGVDTCRFLWITRRCGVREAPISLRLLADAALDHSAQEFELAARDGERGEYHDDVPERADHDPVVARPHADAVADARGVGVLPFRAPGAHEFDPRHEAALPYIADVREEGDPPEQAREQSDLGLHTLQHALLLEQIEVGQGGGAGEGVPGVRVAVKEGLLQAERREEAVVDPPRRERGGERQVAARDPLRHGEEVRRHPLPFAGEDRPRAPEPGRDLVGDEQDVVRAAELRDRGEVPVRRDDHPSRGLHERLDDERRDLLPAPFEESGEGRETLAPARGAPLPERAAVAVERRPLHRPEEEGAVDLVEEADPPDAHRPERVAVVGVGETDELSFPPPAPAAVLPVLEGELQGDLDRRRAVVGEEDLLDAGRGDPDQPLGELRGRRAPQPQKGRVRDLPELPHNRTVDLPFPVPVDVDPERGDPVEVPPPVRVLQPAAPRRLYHRLLLPHPVPHLRKRVPDETAVLLPRRGARSVLHGSPPLRHGAFPRFLIRGMSPPLPPPTRGDERGKRVRPPHAPILPPR